MFLIVVNDLCSEFLVSRVCYFETVRVTGCLSSFEFLGTHFLSIFELGESGSGEFLHGGPLHLCSWYASFSFISDLGRHPV